MKTKNHSQPGRLAGAPLQCQTSPPHRILVVDDDISIRKVNTEMLLGSGYEVDAAEDGDAAWQALNADRYDLLVTDHNMPKVSGVELLKRLRAARMDLPAILVSGVMPTEELNRYPWLQIEARLLKPYTAEELLGTVAEVLRATDEVHERSEPPSNWQSQPSHSWQV
jgi:DNA-binding response OmpR family regulator